MIETIDIDGTTAAGGGAVADSDEVVLGEVLMVEVLGNNLTAGANLVLKPITQELGGVAVLGESIVDNGAIGATDGLGGGDVSYLYPRRFAEDAAGAVLDIDETLADDQRVALPFFVAGHKLRATISAGGSVVDFRIRVVVRTD